MASFIFSGVVYLQRQQNYGALGAGTVYFLSLGADNTTSAGLIATIL
jgi:hypothetical protein